MSPVNRSTKVKALTVVVGRWTIRPVDALPQGRLFEEVLHVSDVIRVSAPDPVFAFVAPVKGVEGVDLKSCGPLLSDEGGVQRIPPDPPLQESAESLTRQDRRAYMIDKKNWFIRWRNKV